MSDKVTYSSYIQPELILATQQPLSRREDVSTFAAERYFIVVHQISELYASQIFADLEAAYRQMAAAEPWMVVSIALARASSIAFRLCQILEDLIGFCPRETFLEFRSHLEGASALQSSNFQQLLDIARGKNVYVDHMTRLFSKTECSDGVENCSCNLCMKSREEAKNALQLIVQVISLWRELHLSVASHFIGALPGTGGTPGVKYLIRSMEADQAVLTTRHENGYESARQRRAELEEKFAHLLRPRPGEGVPACSKCRRGPDRIGNEICAADELGAG